MQSIHGQAYETEDSVEIEIDALLLRTAFSNEGGELKKKKRTILTGEHLTELLRTAMTSFEQNFKPQITNAFLSTNRTQNQ